MIFAIKSREALFENEKKNMKQIRHLFSDPWGGVKEPHEKILKNIVENQIVLKTKGPWFKPKYLLHHIPWA